MRKINVILRGIYCRIVLVAGLIALSGPASALLPFEKTGNLYVSLWNTDEIAVFTPDGTVQEIFTATGLDGPRGIAFNPPTVISGSQQSTATRFSFLIIRMSFYACSNTKTSMSQ